MEQGEEARWREAIAATLRAERGIAGFSQAEMERRTGITRSSYRYYEKAERLPDMVALAKIAEALGVSLSRIVGEIERRASE